MERAAKVALSYCCLFRKPAPKSPAPFCGAGIAALVIFRFCGMIIREVIAVLKVMVVDDDFASREGMVEEINWTRLGCCVIAQANDGAEALEKIAREVPDVLFTDVVMPRMDGLELMEQVRARYPQIAVVVLSAYDEAPYVRRSLSLEAVEYLLKPYDEQQVEKVLGKIRARQQTPMRHVQDNLADEDYQAIRSLSDQALEALKQADPAQVEARVKALFDRIAALNIRSMLFITSCCVDLLTKAVGVVKKAMPGESHLEIRSMLDMVARVRNVDQMRELTLHALRGMACTIAASSSEMSRIVKQVCQIISDEYMTNLTIPQIADRLHVSVNYLQSQFKKENGRTIRQYLTDTRIEQAQRLLLQTNRKVSDICEQVGYKDTDYFVRIFREATGVTPNEYRKSGI